MTQHLQSLLWILYYVGRLTQYHWVFQMNNITKQTHTLQECNTYSNRPLLWAVVPHKNHIPKTHKSQEGNEKNLFMLGYILVWETITLYGIHNLFMCSGDHWMSIYTNVFRRLCHVTILKWFYRHLGLISAGSDCRHTTRPSCNHL